ncbi:MAG: rhomboid family intramembrane serine protease [Lachnospiraceae bacterium]
MKPKSKFEKKYGKYAISNLTLMLIMCYAVGYVIQFINPTFLSYLSLNPYKILQGQVWRIVTWLIVPPASFDFFTLLMLYVYYSIGTMLERVWGTWKYNVFLLGGILASVISSFLLLLYFAVVGGYSGADLVNISAIASLMFSTYYVNLSILLGYAATFPDMKMLLMFVFPIKVKVLGIIYAILMVFYFITGDVFTKFVIGASLLNVAIFLLRNNVSVSPKRIVRQQVRKAEVKKVVAATKIHKCEVCGRTSTTNPELEFRFCSKCKGNYEYCQDHLFTHEHKQ